MLWGDLDAARPHASSLVDLADRRSYPQQLASFGFHPITLLSCLEGDWNAGREYSDRCWEASPLSSLVLLPRVLLEHETGEYAQGEVYLERLLEAMRRPGPDQMLACGLTSMAIPTIARITGFPDRLEIAEAAADAVLSAQLSPERVLVAKFGLALLAAQKGDQSAAEEHYDYLLEQRGTMLRAPSSVDRLLGILS